MKDTKKNSFILKVWFASQSSVIFPFCRCRWTTVGSNKIKKYWNVCTFKITQMKYAWARCLTDLYEILHMTRNIKYPSWNLSCKKFNDVSLMSFPTMILLFIQTVLPFTVSRSSLLCLHVFTTLIFSIASLIAKCRLWLYSNSMGLFMHGRNPLQVHIKTTSSLLFPAWNILIFNLRISLVHFVLVRFFVVGWSNRENFPFGKLNVSVIVLKMR